MMHLSDDLYSLVPLAVLITAVLLVYHSWKYRKSRLGVTFIVLMSALAWWSLAAFMERNSLDLSVKYLWIKMTYFGITFLPVTWLTFALLYTDRDKWVTRRNLGVLAIIPIVTLAMVWTNDIHHLMWKDIRLDTSVSPPGDAVTHGAWFWVYAAYAYSLLLLGTLCLFRILVKSTTIYRKQVGTLLVATLVPWIGNILFIAGIGPFTRIDPTPVAFAITGIAFFWGLSRFQLLNIMPIAHEAIFKSMTDGVMVLDKNKQIMEVNPAAERIIGVNRSEIIGKPCSQALPLFQTNLFDLEPGTTEKQAEIEIGQGPNKRNYLVNISSVKIRQNLNGNIVLLRDETERKKAEYECKERDILAAELTERKRAHEELEKSEEKYSTIVEKGNDGILIIQDGRVKFANSKMTEFTGFTQAETIERSFLDFVSEDYRTFTMERYKRRMSGEVLPGKYEIAIRTKNGNKVPVEINANKIEYEGKPADMALVRDITERKKAEETLKASEAKFRNLVENAAAGIVTTLPDGHMLNANKAALQIFGYDKEEELSNKAILERYADPEDRGRLLQLIKDKGVAKGFEVRMKRKDNTLFWASLNMIVQTTQTGERQLLAITEDITERKQAEDELSRLNKELKSFNSRLEAKVEERTLQLENAVTVARASDLAKSEFLASMSHELRTPLNAIIGFSQVLKAKYFGNLNDKQTEYVTDILDSGKHLLSLINDILDLSKIEAGKMELEKSEIKIEDILNNSLIMIKEKAQVHKIRLSVEIAKNLEGIEITADERRLKQVMFNLLSNAIKFTPDGGAIRLQAKIEKGELVLSVSDTGIGISPDEQKKLFTAFYQASGGITNKTPGTGLGLAITKNIVEKHGGNIWVESGGSGKGSMFCFTLPIHITAGVDI